MTFRIHFIPPPSSTTAPGPPSEFDLDAIEGVLDEVCEALSEMGAEFRMGGFGEANWPVDVTYDLPILLEQIPDLTRSVLQGTAFTLEMYGQGVERGIEVVPDAGMLTLRCMSGTDWQPDPAVETMMPTELLRQLAALRRAFLSAAGSVRLRTGLDLLERWRDETNALDAYAE